MKSSILIIDDDERLGDLLTEYLGGFGYEVSASYHPDDGLAIIERSPPNLIVLDVMLPDKDGFEVCRLIRQNHNIPIIMLTARGDVTDRVVGLELGADDYLSKPFEPRELAARIQTVLRRTPQNQEKPKKDSGKKTFGKLEIDFHKQRAKLQGEEVDLTTMEFDMLGLLIQHNGQVMSRDEIIEQLHGYEWDAFNRSIDILMSRLRSKLKDDPKHPQFIKTVWGKGYLFIGGEKNEST